MGRKRTANKHLPRHVYRTGKSYYFWADRTKPKVRLGNNFADAMRAYADLDVFRDDATTMADVFARYGREVAPTLARPKERLNELKRLAEVFGGMRPSDIEPRHVYKYLDLRGRKAPVAANREKARLSAVLSYAVRWGLISVNPCKQVERLPEKPRDRYVTDAEYALAYQNAGEALQVLMDAALLTGLRAGDLQRLTLDAVRDDGLYVETNKTGKSIIIEWSEALREVVDRARQLRRARVTSMARPLFVTATGKAWTQAARLSAWGRIMAKLPEEVRFAFQDLRPKSASDATGLLEASRRLAHGDPRITQRVYTRSARRVKPLR